MATANITVRLADLPELKALVNQLTAERDDAIALVRRMRAKDGGDFRRLDANRDADAFLARLDAAAKDK